MALGRPEIATAERAARRLIDLSPYREAGYEALMQALERQGNFAVTLRLYERLRAVLREELGVIPSPAVQRVHQRLLQPDSTT